MRNFILKILSFIGKSILSLRYKIEIRGEEHLDKKHLNKKGGLLILPNHPAYIDPLIVVLYFWQHFEMRPLAIEYIFRHPLINFFMRLLNALPIPNFETSINEIKIKKAEETLEEIVKGLKKKDAFLLYPSGRVKHGAKEVLGGASAAHSIIEKCPDTNVVLVRTTGLWGSIFSRAIEKKSLDGKKMLWKGLKTLLKNGIFFCKRRKVILEIETNPKSFPRKSSRIDFNRYLQKWYNQYPVEGKRVEEEPLNLVSYSFYKKDYPRIQNHQTKQKDLEVSKRVPQQNREKLYVELSNIAQIPKEKIHDDMNLALDLGLDSLDIASVVAFLADHFDTGVVHPEDVETVRDALEVSLGEKKRPADHSAGKKYEWPEESFRFSPEIPVGKTIMEAFLRNCERMGNVSAVADDLTGVMSYKKLKRSVVVLALYFKKMPHKHIGVLLPASSIAYIVILAIMMANKIPVMLNWTLGPKYLNETTNQTKTHVVISSWKFLERLTHVEFGDMIKKIKLLEDVKKEIKIQTKLQGLFRSMRSYYKILKGFGIHKKASDSIAVILFTSGTEALPKGVPLSHKNILSNQAAALQCVYVCEEDVMLGILPPFHSFGFSVAGLFPILTGTKIAFYPDPTDSFALAKQVQKWKVTLFCGAPSFLRGVLHAATKQELSSVRLFVSGAEKPPPEIFEQVKALGKDKIIIEGYGITECAPMLSLNRVGMPAIGVGQLIPGIEMCTIHPETGEPLPEHSEGEICVRGPNVFQGYLNLQKSPFIELHGRSWYRTGDLGYLDKRGNIILSGRLKRFAKIGGEMISLGGIESVLCKAVNSQKSGEEGPQLAVCVDEKDETKSSLILFTTLELNAQRVNEILKEAGFSRLVKITDVKQLKEIPMTGTGKTDYRKLQGMMA